MLHFRCLMRGAELSLACLILLAGCGRSAAVTVSGKITLDGTPLDDATISFVPVTGGQRNAGWATVEKGRYAIPESSELGSGSFRVEIRALRAAGEKSNQNDPTLMFAKEALPAKYNSKSELVTDLKVGANTADFDLKSK
jgi:hypothetical protein